MVLCGVKGGDWQAGESKIEEVIKGACLYGRGCRLGRRYLTAHFGVCVAFARRVQ